MANAPRPDDGARRLVLLRYSGDVSTKSRGTRFAFAKRLVRNLRDALASEGLPSEVRVSHDRVFAELPAGADPSVLARVFGIQSLACVERRTEPSLDAIVRAGVELFSERVRGRSFAVRARRVGPRDLVPVKARDVERELGTELLRSASRVDLSNPEFTARVELLPREAYLLGETLPGHAGLPLGVEGRAVVLISGGFDSAVAAWQLMKRGVAMDYVFCNLGGATHEHGTLRVAKVLADRWSYGERPRFFSVDFHAFSEELQARTERRYWQVLLKRGMLRAAERVARRRRAIAIVTGEAVGQVSSQTLQNLAAISPATTLPILRPLVGLNKDEILAGARAIGTYEVSAVVGEYCALVPRRPATAAKLAAVEEQEARLDPELLERAVAGRREIDLRALDLEKLDLPELEIHAIPEGAVVIDLRSRAEYDSWHHPEALRMDFPRAVTAYPSFDRSRAYVLYCEVGLKSAHLAEFMRREGFEAHHFRGGVRALRRLVESR